MQKYQEFLEEKKKIDIDNLDRFQKYFLGISDDMLQVYELLFGIKPLKFIKERQDSPYAKGSLRKSVLFIIDEGDKALPKMQSLFQNMEYSISGASESLVSDQIKYYNRTSKNAMDISIVYKNVTTLLSQLATQNDASYNTLLRQKSTGMVIDNKQLKDALNKLIKGRKAQEKNRNAFIQSAKRSEQQLSEDLQLISSFCHKRNTQMILLIKFFGDVLKECGRLINNFSQPTIKNLESIDTRNDFTVFVDYFKIARYDLTIKPFVPIDLSHKAFQGLEPILPPPRINSLPVAVGLALFDFQPESGKELGLKKNSHILLCHPAYGNDKWVLALRSGDLKPGYVPRSFVKTVGSGLGVVFKECAVRVGAPVAIMEINRNKMEASVVDLNGVSKVIPSSCIKIIGGEPIYADN